MVDLTIIDTGLIKATEFISWGRDYIVGIVPEYSMFVQFGIALGLAWAISKYVRSDNFNFLIDAIFIYVILVLI